MRTINIISSLGVFLLLGCSVEGQKSQCIDEEILFTNGKVITLNKENDIFSSLRVRGNRIIEVGNNTDSKEACTKIIDLKGKSLIPGLIDSHSHFVRQGNMPGIGIFEAENIKSIKDLILLLKSESLKFPPQHILTVVGGITINQFSEKRLPTFKELNDSLPDRPVYIQLGFSGPAIANKKALEILKGKGIKTNSNGTFSFGKETNTAFSILNSFNNKKNRKEGLQRLIIYANSLGLTSIHDQGGVEFPGAAKFETHSDYKGLLSLWKDKELNLRVRVQHVIYDKSGEDGEVEAKLNNTWAHFGDDMLKYTTMGEHIVSFPINGEVNPAYMEKALKVARKGWTHEQHSTSYKENIQHLSAIKKINEKHSIKKLRWSLSHTFEMGIDKTKYMLSELKRMEMGLKLQSHGYVVPTDKFPLGKTFKSSNAGPLYRTLLKTGIHLGAGTDSVLLVPLNPWLSIYYMVTGKDVLGKLVNKNETISRLEALRMYTLGNAWFTFEDKILGSLEVGKIADFVVLNKDFLNISNEEIKTIRADMTFVNGRLVYKK